MGNQFSVKIVKWTENETGCHICNSHSKDSSGYVRIKVGGKLDRLHRVMYREKFGEIPLGKVVMHKCDNPSCINIEHLLLGTQKENMRDCVNKNRQWLPKGSKNGRSKLTDEQSFNIYKDTRKQKDIAKEYGISQPQVSYIKCNKTWKDHDKYIKGVA